MRLLAPSMLAVMLCACAPDDGNKDPNDVVAAATLQASEYCETVVDLFCPFYVRCGRMAVADEAACRPVFLEACNARYEPSFVALADAQLLVLSTAAVTACQAHLSDVSCTEQALDLQGPCAGMWQGQQPAGAACSYDVENFVCSPGTACSVGLDLCGTCETVVDVGERCDTEGVTCGADAQCDGDVCVARTAGGEACDDSSICMLGAGCRDGICQPPRYAQVGETCDVATRCPYASACIGGVCVRSSELGGPCGEDRSCDSGRCDQGTCVEFLPQGATCTSSAACQTGACIDGTCRSLPSSCVAP